MGRHPGRRFVAAVVAAFVALAVCAEGATAPVATMAAETTATASPSPAATPVPDGWPVAIRSTGSYGGPVVAADGTAYAWVAGPGDVPRLASFDRTGRLRPGWPVDLAPAFSGGWLEALTDRTVLAQVMEAKRGEDVAVVHRLRPDGRELPGWPVRIEGTPTVYRPVEGPGGSVWLAWPTRGSGGKVAGFDRLGKVRRGWPVTVKSGYVGGDAMRVTRDGTVYVLVAADSNEGRARLWAYSASGRVLKGWPITLRSNVARFDVLPDARVLVATYLPPRTPPQGLCSDARATVLAEIGRDGRTIAGWPRTATGWASSTVIGKDGTVYYAAADRLFARAPDGSVRPGWPVAIPKVYPQCGGVGPYLGPDGTVYVMAGNALHAFTAVGRRRAGWPFVPAAGFTGHPCVADAPGPLPPAFAADGTVYVPTWVEAPGTDHPGRAGISAVDARGRMVPGWPFVMSAPVRGGLGATGLTVAAGHLYATLYDSYDSCSGIASLVALEPDGSIAR